MTIDPRYRDSWQGFVDLMRPPSGYRLAAAFGTAFGLSFEALVAALLAMTDADGENLARDPAAAVVAITRLRERVRVLVHPATISTPAREMPKQLIALLDSFIGEVRPKVGLFHPKVWTLRFSRIGSDLGTDERGRIVICSRNLTGSRAFELGATFEGAPLAADDAPPPFVRDVAAALRTWMALAGGRLPPALAELPAFVGRLSIDVPHEGRDATTFHWQAPGRVSLDARLPNKCGRSIVVSPFVQSDFVSRMLDRTTELQIVSTAECLDELDDEIFGKIERRTELQRAPVLYQINEYGDPDGAFLDSLHAKLVLVDGPSGASTFVGSANATAPGWGFSQARNVEAMVELRPGIALNTFVKSFILETRQKLHPWITEYDRAQRDDQPEREVERLLLNALRDVALVELSLDFDETRQTLKVSLAHEEHDLPRRIYGAESLQFELAPLSISERDGAWRPLASLTSGPLLFEEVQLTDVTAFIALRARSLDPPGERIRVILGRLKMTADELHRRDDAARTHLLSNADPAVVLEALVRGIAHMRNEPGAARRSGVRGGASIQQLLAHTSLELLLQAVALDRTLISDLRALIGPFADDSFHEFCGELEQACATVAAERLT